MRMRSDRPTYHFLGGGPCSLTRVAIRSTSCNVESLFNRWSMFGLYGFGCARFGSILGFTLGRPLNMIMIRPVQNNGSMASALAHTAESYSILFRYVCSRLATTVLSLASSLASSSSWQSDTPACPACAIASHPNSLFHYPAFPIDSK